MGRDVQSGKTGGTIHLCGDLYVSVGGRRREVPEGSKRLLAFVALRGFRVDRRVAAGALWPFGDDARATGNLRSALWRLRGAGVDVVDADRHSLGLRSDVKVDCDVVGEWADRLITGRQLSADLAVSPMCDGALDLLPGWFDEWVVIERERLRQRVLHALEALSRLLTDAGCHADAVDVAMTAVQSDPLRETAQRVLLEAYIAEGNLTAARQKYLAYRRLLEEELQVEPAAGLTELVGARTPRAPTPPPTPPPTTGRSGASGRLRRLRCPDAAPTQRSALAMVRPARPTRTM